MRALLVDMFSQIIECWKCNIHIYIYIYIYIYILIVANTGTHAFPDINALTLGQCVALGIMHTCVTDNALLPVLQLCIA